MDGNAIWIFSQIFIPASSCACPAFAQGYGGQAAGYGYEVKLRLPAYVYPGHRARGKLRRARRRDTQNTGEARSVQLRTDKPASALRSLVRSRGRPRELIFYDGKVGRRKNMNPG